MRLRYTQLTLIPLLLSLSCSDDADPSARVVGVAADWLTGQGIANADVTLVNGQNWSTTTGEDGSFSLSNLPRDEGLLILSATGYSPTRIRIQTSTGAGAIVQVTMIPADTTIGGRVRVGKTPLAGASVRVACYGVPVASGQTDAQGTYAFPNLELCNDGVVVGAYTVSIFADTDGDGLIDENPSQVIPATRGISRPVNFVLAEPENPALGNGVRGRIVTVTGVPVDGATVMIRGTGQTTMIAARTSGGGSFTFDVPTRFQDNYTIWVMPHDLDGDGWVDTGPLANVNVDWQTGWNNIRLRLPRADGAAYTAISNSSCDAGSADRYISPGEPIYFLWGASVRTNGVQARMFGPDNASVTFDAAWTGQYLLTLTPNPQLTASLDPNEEYRVEINGLVFEDGVVGEDPNVPNDSLNCGFRVAAPGTPLVSPTPSFDASAGQGATGATFDTATWRFTTGTAEAIDVNSAAPTQPEAGRPYTAVPLKWNRVAGAVEYVVYGRQSNQVAGSPQLNDWTELARETPGTAFTASEVFTTVDITRFDGGDGDELSFGNQIDLVIQPIDAYGEESPIEGTDGRLSIRDTRAPRVTGFVTGAPTFVEGVYSVPTFRMNLSEAMNTQDDITTATLSPLGGRLASLQNPGYWRWGNDFGRNETADFFEMEAVQFAYNLAGSRSLSTPDGDGLIESAEIGALPAEYAWGQTVGYHVAATNQVRYEPISGINTREDLIVLPGVIEATGDTIFEPCSSTGRVSVEARAGTQTLTMSAGSPSFYPGQTIRIGEQSGFETITITDVTGSQITLQTALVSSHEIGSFVSDPNCATSVSPRGTRALIPDSLLGPTRLESTTRTMDFRFPVSPADVAGGIVAGDSIYIDLDNVIETRDDAYRATIEEIETVDATGAPLVSDGIAYVRLGISAPTPVGAGALPMDIDPTEARIDIITDGMQVTATIRDASGNAIDTTWTTLTFDPRSIPSP